MILPKGAVLAIVAIAFAAAGCVQAPAPHAAMKMTDADHMKMQSCMSMSHEDMMKSSGCTSMMSGMKMSEADMTTMMACRKMPHADMMKDERCMSMMKMHSSMIGDEAPKLTDVSARSIPPSTVTEHSQARQNIDLHS